MWMARLLLALALCHLIASVAAEKADNAVVWSEEGDEALLEESMRSALTVTGQERAEIEPVTLALAGATLALALLNIAVQKITEAYVNRVQKQVNKIAVACFDAVVLKLKEFAHVAEEMNADLDHVYGAGAKIAHYMSNNKKGASLKDSSFGKYFAVYEKSVAELEEARDEAKSLAMQCVNSEGKVNPFRLKKTLLDVLTASAFKVKNIFTAIGGTSPMFHSASLQGVFHSMSPIVGVSIAAIQVGISTFSLVDTVKRCKAAKKQYEEKKETFLLDADYTFCQLYGTLSHHLASQAKKLHALYDKVPESERNEELVQLWEAYISAVEGMHQHMLDAFDSSQNCIEFTKVPPSNKPPIRELWATSQFRATAPNKESVNSMLVKVVNQPSKVLNKKTVEFSYVEFYQPSKKELEEHPPPEEKPTDSLTQISWTYGVKLWSPITSIEQQMRIKSFFDPEYLNLDSELTYTGLLHNEELEPVMWDRDNSRQRDARVEMRRICRDTPTSLWDESTRNRCIQIRAMINPKELTEEQRKIGTTAASISLAKKRGHPNSIDNPYYLEPMSYSLWKKDGRNGQPPVVQNFCKPVKFRGLIKMFMEEERQRPYLMMFYGRGAGAPITDMVTSKITPEMVEASKKALEEGEQQVKAEEEALAKKGKTTEDAEQEGVQKKKEEEEANEGPKEIPSEPLLPDTLVDQGEALERSAETLRKVTSVRSHALGQSVSEISDLDSSSSSSSTLLEVLSKSRGRRREPPQELVKNNGWRMVPYAMGQVSNGCPVTIMEVAIQKDYHIDMPPRVVSDADSLRITSDDSTTASRLSTDSADSSVFSAQEVAAVLQPGPVERSKSAQRMSKKK